MSRTSRSQPRLPLVVAGLVLIGLAASVAATQAAVHGDRGRSAYFAEFTGVGPEGRDMGWHGAVAGASVGELTVRLAPAGKITDSARPEWPVEGVIFVTGEDPRRAFAADVRGTIDWRTKRLTLEGEVTVGYLRGAHVEQTADLIDLDLSGDLRVTPPTLAVAR